MAKQLATKKKKTRKEGLSAPIALFSPIFALLARAGFSDTEISEICARSLKKASSSKVGPNVFRIGYDYITADLIHRWLRDPKYINSNGKPKDLLLTGNCSFQSLVKESESRASPIAVADLLVKFGTIRKLENGSLRLVRRSLNFAISESLPFEPNLKFLIDAVRSCTRGLAQRSVGPRLYWHCADSRQVERKDVESFLKFSEERSLSFMHEINDWLDQHASNMPKKRLGRIQRVGVGLFAIGEADGLSPSNRAIKGRA